MTDRFVWSCRACQNAIVAGITPPDREACPVCRTTRDDRPMGELWSREGQIR
jgi:rubrerythrin